MAMTQKRNMAFGAEHLSFRYAHQNFRFQGESLGSDKLTFSFKVPVFPVGDTLNPTLTPREDTIRKTILSEAFLSEAFDIINERVLKRVPKRTLGQEMISIPHTLRTLPAEPPKAYFYYFTDEIYRSEQSKYRLLDDLLTLLGRHRKELEVIIIDRDRIPSKLWDIITKGLGIENYPALVVSSHPLGIEELDINATEYHPSAQTFAKLERGYIADQFLSDRDELISLLNELFDAAREGIAEKTLRRAKILKVLETVGKSVRDIIAIAVDLHL